MGAGSGLHLGTIDSFTAGEPGMGLLGVFRGSVKTGMSWGGSTARGGDRAPDVTPERQGPAQLAMGP